MNDVLRSAQCVERLRTQQTVSVGDDADREGSSQFPVSGYFFFIFSTNLPMLTTARPTVPWPISWVSSRAVTRRT